VDTINYALVFGFLGRLVRCWQVLRDLASIFEYRKERAAALLE